MALGHRVQASSGAMPAPEAEIYLRPHDQTLLRTSRSEGDTMAVALNRTKESPWKLKTPPGTSEYTMHVDERDGRKILVCTVGSTVLHYDARCIEDLYAMLKGAGDWVDLGGADEQKPAKDGTVEAWGRSPTNPIGGWYGLKKGLRGRFGVYVPPLMEELGLCELEHNAKNNRVRAK